MIRNILLLAALGVVAPAPSRAADPAPPPARSNGIVEPVMRARVLPGRRCTTTPCSPRPSSTSPVTTQVTQVTQVVVVNGVVLGDVIVQGVGTTPRPRVLGSGVGLPGRETVQPVVTPSGRVVVRRW